MTGEVDLTRLESVAEYIHELEFDDIPVATRKRAQQLLLDLAGVAAAGTMTPMSRIARDHAARFHPAGERWTRLPFDGRTTGPMGAAFAAAATIDSFDAHDGHNLTKGHVGVAVLPALLALMNDDTEADGRELLTRFVLGYEVGNRAGVALHASAPEYHSSGAWNALGAAAIVCRELSLSTSRTAEALGIAEFFGPRSPLMRDVDYPTMVKDGSSHGAAVGVEAAFLAASGFTGAPAMIIAEDSKGTWTDLGKRWHLDEQYVKAFPVCRWAHPAMEAVTQLRQRLLSGGHSLSDVDHIEVASFHAAIRLATREPATTEQAQYSLPFPVATAFVHGHAAGQRLVDPTTADPEVQRFASGMQLVEEARYEREFPAERYAHATLVLKDGTEMTTPSTTAPGTRDNPISEGELKAKYRELVATALDDDQSHTLEVAIDALPDDNAAGALVRIMFGDSSVVHTSTDS